VPDEMLVARASTQGVNLLGVAHDVFTAAKLYAEACA